MLHWNDLHPYNAMGIFRLPAALDLGRLKQIINGALAAHGLTGLTLNRSGGTFHYAGGQVDCEIKVISGGADSQAALSAEIEVQLNTAFVLDKGFNPFRFFAVTEADGFWIGIVFIHVIADGLSITLLAREVIEAYLKPGEPPVFQPFELYPHCRDGLLSQPKLLFKKLAALPAFVREMRSSSRLWCRDENDFSNRFAFFTLDAGQLEALIKTAKACHITLNDLFLTLLLKSLSGMASDRQLHPRRRKIAVGCIVNVRKGFGLKGQRAFGPFLGSLVVTHELPKDTHLTELAKDICRQTTAIKKSRLYLASSWEQAFGRFMFALHSPARRKQFYDKNFPLWGGLTSMQVNAFWEPAPGERPMDCFSVAGTGPVVPLVFSVVTAETGVKIAITYRPAFFSEIDVARIKNVFIEMVAQLKN